MSMGASDLTQRAVGLLALPGVARPAGRQESGDRARPLLGRGPFASFHLSLPTSDLHELRIRHAGKEDHSPYKCDAVKPNGRAGQDVVEYATWPCSLLFRCGAELNID